jgi:hypothetical protein
MSTRGVDYEKKYDNKLIRRIIMKMNETNTKIVIHLPYVINSVLTPLTLLTKGKIILSSTVPPDPASVPYVLDISIARPRFV